MSESGNALIQLNQFPKNVFSISCCWISLPSLSYCALNWTGEKIVKKINYKEKRKKIKNFKNKNERAKTKYTYTLAQWYLLWGWEMSEIDFHFIYSIFSSNFFLTNWCRVFLPVSTRHKIQNLGMKTIFSVYLG